MATNGRRQKNSVSQALRNRVMLLTYQWESLRTNPEYIRDYERFQRIWGNPRVEHEGFWPRIELFFHRKYGITPMNPAVPFPKRCPDQVKPASKEMAQLALWMYFVELGKPAYSLSPMIEDAIRARLAGLPEPNSAWRDPSDADLQKRHSIIVAINLDEPISRIISTVRDIVKSLQRRKTLLMGKNAERTRLKEYEMCHQTYALHEQGLSWLAIAKRRYPADFERDRYYACRKAKRDCARWRKIGFDLRNSALTNSIPMYSLKLNTMGILSQEQYMGFSKLRHHNEKRQASQHPV